MNNLDIYLRSGLSLVFTMLVILFLVDSFSLSRVAGWIPQATLATTLLLLVMQLLAEFSSGLRDRKKIDESRTAGENRVKTGGKENSIALVILRISALAPMVWLFGMSVGAAMYCLVYLRWHAEESWKFSIIFSFALGFVLQMGFSSLLDIALYPGVITRVLT